MTLSIAMRACLRAVQSLVSSRSGAAAMLWLIAVLTAGPAMASERLMPSEWTARRDGVRSSVR